MTTKTKAELIEEWAQEDCQADSVSQPRTCPEQYYKMGALRAFEHADKETRAWEVKALAAENAVDAVNRWWAERWTRLRDITTIMEAYENNDVGHALSEELDARAKEVLEGK